jgi:hypothetical protein
MEVSRLVEKIDILGRTKQNSVKIADATEKIR